MIQGQLVALAALSSDVLSGGVAFLYDQAGELLQGHRGDTVPEGSAAPVTSARIAEIEGRSALMHVPNLSHVNENVLSATESDIEDLLSLLRPYRDGELPVSGENIRLLERMARLRVALQAVYGQRIAFLGEDPASVPSPLMGLDVVISLVRGRTMTGPIEILARVELDVTRVVDVGLPIGRPR
jgi:hypothetical protein